MSWLYLSAIVLSGLGTGVLDHRWRLLLFGDRRRRRAALAVVLVGTVGFLLWDLAAIEGGMYEKGDSTAMTGVELADELPLEELFFVVFLCYVTLVTHGLADRLLAAREQTRERTRR